MSEKHSMDSPHERRAFKGHGHMDVVTLGDFTNVQLMTGGAPGDSTHVLATLAYRYTFRLGKIDWGVGVFATALPVTLLFIFVLIKKIK